MRPDWLVSTPCGTIRLLGPSSHSCLAQFSHRFPFCETNRRMDELYDLDASHNSEIRSSWLKLCIDAGERWVGVCVGGGGRGDNRRGI